MYVSDLYVNEYNMNASLNRYNLAMEKKAAEAEAAEIQKKIAQKRSQKAEKRAEKATKKAEKKAFAQTISEDFDYDVCNLEFIN